MDTKKLSKGYNGYLLTPTARGQLLTHIPPAHNDVIAHHITHRFGVYEELPPEANTARVVAVACNETVQAAVVKINGTIDRGDGSFYHVTVSIDRAAGAKPADSNTLIRDSRNWTAVESFNIDITPKFFSFG
jgi:hypothetical protein